MTGQEIWVVAKPHIEGLLMDLLEKAMKPALEEAIAKSGNPSMIAIASVLEVPLLAAIKEQITHL